MIAGIQIYEALHLLFANDLRLADKTHYADKTRYALKPTAGRIYPDMLTEHDDKTIPYVVYQNISTVPEVTLDGVTGHEWVRMQIDVYHNDKYQAVLLANRVVQEINDNIQPSIYSARQSLREGNLFRESIDYEFWQTAPTEDEME